MQARRQQRERIAGVLLAILGVAVLVIAVVALATPDSNDNGGSDAAATDSASATTSARPSSTPTTSSPQTTRSTKATSSSASGPSLSLGNSIRAEGGKAKKLPLVVLNNTRTNGLATDAADEFRNGGWKVDDVGNITDDIISTCAYYDPDVDGAERSAKALRTQFDGIDRVLPKFSGLPSGPIVVVLTSGYSSN